MTPRAQRLLARAREQRGTFWQRRVWLAESRALTAGRPAAIRQALALKHILEMTPAVVASEELLVGTHPESAPPNPPPPGVPLKPSQDPLRLPEERLALSAGVFSTAEKTGHLTPDYPRLLSEGYGGLLRRVEEGPGGPELEAMGIALRAASDFARRHGQSARVLCDLERDARRAQELRRIAEVCDRVAADPPRDTHEALQLLWLTFLIQCMEEGESTAAFALGRFDQYLFPFWSRDLAARCARDALMELVTCFWVKLNEFSGLQVLNLTIGGSDADGNDCVNDLSFACLEIMEEMRTQAPSLSVRWHPGIDREFYRRALRLATSGIGQPAFYNDPAAKKAMEHSGVSPRDAADVVPGGCVELGVQGCCYPWVGNFFNLAKCLELALHDGKEPRTGQQIGPATGAPQDMDTFDTLLDAYQKQVDHAIALMARSDNTTDRLAAEHNPYPFLSSLVGDCIERAKDITAGGARYNFTEVQGVGVPHVVDSLLNVRRIVYENREMDLAVLLAKADAGFEGDEPLRRRLQLMRPAYGDGTEETSALARRVAHGFFDAVDRSVNPRGGPHRPGLLVWTLYDIWANCVGPLPDGRRRGEALASSIGPRGEAPIESPTSIIRDATSFDHWRCAGSLTLNLRFDKSSVKGEDGLAALEALMRVYFDQGGLQAQINVVDGELLRAAKADPKAYAGLVVRVSGFAARFVTLCERMQDEIIARTELSAAR